MKRTIPMKNYIILCLICLGTILVSWYAVDLYKSSNEYQLDQNKRMKILSEVKAEELQNYILDNHDVILYFSSSHESSYEEFENAFKTYLIEEDLTKEIAYVDTDDVSKNFFSTFAKNYFKDAWKKENKSFNAIPNIVVLKDGKVDSMLYMSQTIPNLNDVKNYLAGVGIHD